MTFPAVDQLVAYFKSQGIAFVEPKTETELKEFESKHDVRLPTDFRAFLALGHPAQWDSETVEFYGATSRVVWKY